MSTEPNPADPYAAPYAPVEVELRDPAWAAFLAWLVPGAGHFYQGRMAKGGLFAICILGTFLFGLYLGEGKVVYASLRRGEQRWAYFCQIGVGLPALPALLQTMLVRGEMTPLLGGFMAPPADMRELSAHHLRLHMYFELGTVYTMIAGLLNLLAIYDAWGGPVYYEPKEKKDKAKKPEPEKAPAT